MSFKIICQNCKSEDVAIASGINDYDHVEVAFVCRDCGNEEERFLS